MQGLLAPGTRLQTEAGNTIEVKQFVGAGGEGEVYRVLVEGEQYALKWYYPETATEERKDALLRLIQRGAPSDRFLWPISLALGADSFGYVMPWREERFKSMGDLLKRRVSTTMRAICTAGFELAHNFHLLHARGLCYRDISLGNLSVDPSTGEIRISDNDNVGVNNESVSFVSGTPGFMAPEVVRGEAYPSTDTDLFSLAVLLFYMLMWSHPLEGKKEAAIHCLDLPAMRKLYGEEPVFIFDPRDSSNRPVPGIHDNALIYWNLYPQSLRDLFIRAFTEGLHNPKKRVTEHEWREEMLHLRDSIIYCSHCGAENFYDREKVLAGQNHKCWRCERPIDLPPRLALDRKYVVMLNYDTQLFPHHLDPQRRYDFSSPLAAVVRHPQHPNIWGLKNLSKDTWVAILPGKGTKQVPPGKSVILQNGVQIQFGGVNGEIRQ